jgi:predicted ATPase/DNA-binding winged helix-turn-helix (wHTH) protein
LAEDQTEILGDEMSSAIEQVSFGPFRLSVRSRTLTTDAGPVALPGRAFDVLVALIEGRDTVISKDDLMRRVWSNVVVEENNLHVQIAATRRALGAHANFIMTVPGRGYRFIGDLEGVAPSLPPASAEPPGNLPAEVTALIGRGTELAAASALLAQARLVTLVGPGGVGKTRLALAAAGAAAAQFAGGAWVVELGPVADGGQVPAAAAASLRIEELSGRSLTESTAAALRQRGPVLLLLDGCEHVGAAVAEFAGSLLKLCPELRVLATSQAPLGIDGEHVRRIAPMDLPAETVTRAEAALRYDAVRLFAERAAAADERFAITDATAASVVKICRSLEGIPLALELAAARVPLLGLEPVRLRLANRLALLGDDEGGTGRHTTLRAAIEWSCNLLSAADRQILRRLGVFAGGFTLAAAQEVAAGAGFAEADVVQSVGNLVRRSLLTTGPDLLRPRHRMLEAMREYAVETLGDAQAMAARRHAVYFCRLAETADAAWETSSAADWMLPLAAELDNFRAALAWALSPAGDAGLAARLAAATARIWFEGGHLSEGRDWLTRALARAPESLDHGTAWRLQRGLAELSMDAAAAVTAARAAVGFAAAPAAQGSCLRMLAASLIRLGRYEEAETAALRALDLLRTHGCARTYARCLGDLCILRGCARDYPAARLYNTEAQALLAALGDDRCAAVCLLYAAEFEFADGETTAATILAEQAVGLFRTLNTRFNLEIGLGNLAAYLLAAEDPRGAAAAAAEALTIAVEIEDEPGVAIAILHIALAAALTGDAVVAARLHGFVTAAMAGDPGIALQETEQAIAQRLEAKLAAALAPDRLARLRAEGGILPPKTARQLAFAAVGAACDGGKILLNTGH